MAILLRVNLPLRTPTSVMSVPAAAGLWRCASRFAGECISAGGGCDNAATRPDAFCDQGDASWSFAEASLGGTSHLRLPRILQRFTGNFHHVHHVNPRMPSYRLEEGPRADAGFRSASTLTLSTGLQALRLHATCFSASLSS